MSAMYLLDPRILLFIHAGGVWFYQSSMITKLIGTALVAGFITLFVLGWKQIILPGTPNPQNPTQPERSVGNIIFLTVIGIFMVFVGIIVLWGWIILITSKVEKVR